MVIVTAVLSDAFHGIWGSAVADEIKDVNFVGLNKFPYELVTVVRFIFETAVAIESGNASFWVTAGLQVFGRCEAWMWRRVRGVGDFGGVGSPGLPPNG